MRSFRLVLDHRARLVVAAAGLLLATIVPTLASAAQVTERSIALSNSSKGTSGVEYTVNFKAATANTGAVVVDFCEDTPIIGASCDNTIAGFSTAGVGTSGGNTATAIGTTGVKVVLGTPAGAGDPVSVVLSGIHNPTNAGPLYARIVTYTDGTTNYGYVSPTDLDNSGKTHLDDGGVALSITDSIGVSGAVLESMTFCVSGEGVYIMTQGCTGTSMTAPVLKLGEAVGSAVALSPSAVSTGHVWTQISTNALSGAVVNLKSSTDCGGLKRVGATGCDVPAAGTTGFTAFGTANFGVKLSTAVSTTDGTANGTFQAANGSAYDTSAYKLNWVNGNLSGVSSTYGDPFLDTAGTTINNKVMDLTFGATISNDTPAGLYSTDLSLIATGKF